jgi:hypothetical protein
MIHTFTGTGRIAVPNNTFIDSNLLHIVILQLMSSVESTQVSDIDSA